MKASGCVRCEWAAYSHSFLSGEMRVGEMIVPDGVWTPIMSLPNRFHGDVGGANDVYGPNLGREPLYVSGSPSSSMIWRRSLCPRLFGRVGKDGGCPPIRPPLGGEGVPRLLVKRESAIVPTSSV